MRPPTKCQRHILQRIAEGDTQRKIAFDLGVGYQTVKNHMFDIRKRMGAKSTENAVAIALRKGWIR